MKKVLLLIFFLNVPFVLASEEEVLQEEIFEEDYELTDYGNTRFLNDDVYIGDFSIEKQQAALIEGAFAYLRRGTALQYDSFKKSLYSPPEDATDKNTIYTVCSGFIHQVYSNTISNFEYYNSSKRTYPYSSEEIYDYAKYYTENPDSNHVIVEYVDGNDNICSSQVLGTKDESNVTNYTAYLESKLQPGDVFNVRLGSSGHSMLYVGKRKNNSGEYVGYIIETYYGGKYNVTNHTDLLNDDDDTHGTLRIVPLSQRLDSYWRRRCRDAQTITNVSFVRYISNNTTISGTGAIRLDYPGIDISKTVVVNSNSVTKSQNASVNPGDLLTYTVRITNNSNSSFYQNDNVNSQAYVGLKLKEEIDTNLVDIVEASNYGFNNGNYVLWSEIDIPVGETKTFTYTVRVKNNKAVLGHVLVANGKLYQNDENVYIRTSRVENSISQTINMAERDRISTVYNKLKNDTDKTGLEFIDEIYLDSLGVNLKLRNSNFYDIIDFDSNATNNLVKKVVVKKSGFEDMIYDNYYALRLNINARDDATKKMIGSYTSYRILLSPDEIYKNDRARNIYADMLEVGDIVLAYVGENDTTDDNLVLKAYIYVCDDNNCFLVRKKNDGSLDIIGDINGNYDLTQFLRNLVGDNYVILRPSINFRRLDVELAYLNNYFYDNGIIYGIKRGDKIQDLIDNINGRGNITVKDINDNLLDINTNIRTGSFVNIAFDSDTLEASNYKLSVLGDVTGSGEPSIADAKTIARQIVDGNNLQNEYLFAADYNQDGNIRMNDVMKLLNDIR